MAGSGTWDPLRELQTVQQRMNKLFESALGKTDFDTQEEVDTWMPVGDVYETATALVILLELPGLEQEQIDLRIDGDELVVSGERRIESEQPGEHFHRVERSYGKFSRRFLLSSTVDRTAVAAAYRDGLLRVTLPNEEGKTSESIRVSIQ